MPSFLSASLALGHRVENNPKNNQVLTMQAVGEEKTISSDEVPSIQLGCDRTEYWQSSNRHMPFPLSVPVFPFIRQEVKERFLGLPRPSIPHRGHQWTT